MALQNLSKGISKVFLFFIISLFSSTGITGEFYVYDHIVISQDVTVSAHRLCQDGLFIYFRSKKECNSTLGYFKCDDDLKIAPISFVEKVYSDVGGLSVTQFFEIETQYEYRLFSQQEGAQDQLIFKKTKELPYCQSKEIFQKANVGSWRYANNENEKQIIESLNASGHTLINTPYGQMNVIKNLKTEYLLKDKGLLTPQFNMKSPFCNSQISDNLIWQMSGEYTGNGYEGFQVKFLQSMSNQLYLEKVGVVTDPITRKQKKIFDFTCTPTWGI